MNNLTFSKEFYKIIYKANILAKNNVIEPYHILVGLCTTRNLVSIMLDINKIKLFSNLCTNILNYNINNKFVFKFSIKSLMLISKLCEKKTIINTVDCFNKLLQINDIYIKYFFKYININNLNFYNLFIRKTNVLYIKHLFYYLNFKNTTIIGRYNEIQLIYNILIRRLKKTIVLVGDPGIGRFSIIKGVYKYIKETICNKTIRDFYIFDLLKFLTILSYNDINIKKQELYKWLLVNTNSILILPNLEIIENTEYLISILNIIFLAIRQNNIQLIVTTNINKFSIFIEQNLFLNNLYESLIVKELDILTIFKIVKSKKIKWEKFYKIKLSDNIINKIIDSSTIYNKIQTQPLRALNFMDIICEKFSNKYPKNIHLTNKYFDIIISTIKNINSNSLANKDISVKNLKLLIQKRMVGQKYVINKISNSLKKSLLGFKTDNKPLGSWLLCGPSGTGKTELAKSLAEALFEDEKKIIRFDMSEFMEKHSVSRLIGSPPGYVGYGDKGLLTDLVSKNPYCVLLFDEIEKAHADILNIMLQVLDDGRLTDSTGQTTDFSKTIIILTSNLGCPKQLSEFKKEIFYNQIVYRIDSNIIMNSIRQYFKPELINRLHDILIFQPLELSDLRLILNKFINQFLILLRNKKLTIKIIIQEEVKKYLVNLGYSPIYGARPLKRIFDELIVEPTIDILIKTKIITPHILSYTLDNNKNILYNLSPIFLK